MTLDKAELIALVCHIAIKSGIPIYNFKFPHTTEKKARRRRTQAIAKRMRFTQTQ